MRGVINEKGMKLIKQMLYFARQQIQPLLSSVQGWTILICVDQVPATFHSTFAFCIFCILLSWLKLPILQIPRWGSLLSKKSNQIKRYTSTIWTKESKKKVSTHYLCIVAVHQHLALLCLDNRPIGFVRDDLESSQELFLWVDQRQTSLILYKCLWFFGWWSVLNIVFRVPMISLTSWTLSYPRTTKVLICDVLSVWNRIGCGCFENSADERPSLRCIQRYCIRNERYESYAKVPLLW